MEKKKRILIALLYGLINPVIFILYYNSGFLAKMISLPYTIMFYIFLAIYTLYMKAMGAGGSDPGFWIMFVLPGAFFGQLILLILLSVIFDDIITKIKQQYKKILAVTFAMTFLFLVYTWSDQGAVDNSIVIKKNSSELVLTLDDMGAGWIEGRSRPIDSNGYSVTYLSKESSPFTDPAYDVILKIWRFNSIAEAKKDLENVSSPQMLLKIGDESYLSDRPGIDSLVFRENNIVVTINVFDSSAHLTGPNPKQYAKLIEQKIITAAKEQQETT